jgi:hypothetical protein
VRLQHLASDIDRRQAGRRPGWSESSLATEDIRPTMRRVKPMPALLLLVACATADAPVRRELVVEDGRVAASLECLRYEPARHEATSRVFHHVFAPDGRLVTKGLGGQYPHHRGLFLGWNRVRCGDERLDFWHCSHGETQRFLAFTSPAAMGLTGDWQVAAIDWLAAGGRPVLHELRATRARTHADGSNVLDVRIVLRAGASAVVLDGDPQHAGHQFRAPREFGEPQAPAVRYLRPAEARGQRDDVWSGCAWIAAVLPFADGAVTVLRVEGPGNPPALWSTRAYGRFGSFSRCELEPHAERRLEYTYVVALGERDLSWCRQVAEAARAGG